LRADMIPERRFAEARGSEGACCAGHSEPLAQVAGQTMFSPQDTENEQKNISSRRRHTAVTQSKLAA
jgi:hypothetical protein